jgi:uncharacterized protein (TIGR02001 family)
MSSRVAHRIALHRRAGIAVCATCLFTALLPFDSHAQDAWGGSLAITSDYRVRGLSRTEGDAAVQGGLHARLAPGWIIGAWASTISRDRGSKSALEVDAHTGYAWNVANDWDAKVVVSHYWHPNDPATANYDYDEITASVAFRSQLVANVVYSPNTRYFARYHGSWHSEDGAALSYELTGLQPITPSFAFTAGVGYNDLSQIFETGYWYWNAGVSYSMGPIQFDVSRIDSDSAAQQLFGSAITEAGWSAAISWRF